MEAKQKKQTKKKTRMKNKAQITDCLMMAKVKFQGIQQLLLAFLRLTKK